LQQLPRRDSRLFGALALEFLRKGVPVRFRAEGASMRPNLADGELLTVAPVDSNSLQPGNIVLTYGRPGFQAHRLKSYDAAGQDFQTQGDSGWAAEASDGRVVLGRVTHAERAGQRITLDSRLSYWKSMVHTLIERLRVAARLRIRTLFRFGIFVLACFAMFAISSAPAAAQSADLSLTQTVSATVASPGGNITYNETVTNNGPNAAVTAVLYQQTPPNTTFVSMTPSAGWTCTNPGAGVAGQVICTDGANLANGGTANFVFVVQINSGASAPASGTTILNYADVTSTTTDPTPGNNTVVTSTLVETAGGADLAVTMAASPTPVFMSSTMVYTVQVQNLGPVATTSATLSDTIPATTTFVSVASSPAGVSCTGTTTVSCSLGALPVGSTATITITVTSPASASPISNTASLTASAPTDPVSSNNSATVITVVQPLVCALPGNNGAGGTLTGIVNTYYPPGAAVTTVNAGATTFVLGGAAATPASQTAIAVGDLLLIIQMQGATINSTNTSQYGSGLPGDPASGSTSLGNSGKFEFVTATSAVPITGGTLNFTGTGAGGGLLNNHSQAAAAPVLNPTAGQMTFQVIRVPQYTTATLSSTLKGLAWNGATGGVLALDVASQLTLGGNVALDAQGFRGGGGRELTGGTGASTDEVTLSTAGTNGSKGEGIAGTPQYLANATITAITNSGNEGYPNGSYARGAPGDAGGGATDADPASNDQNSGGGAGGNGGFGGTGGFGWNSAGIVGGFGGASFPASTSAIVMGGGGGAGTTNNGTAWDPTTQTGSNNNGINSSGAAGGGIVIIRAGSFSGTGTITANGQTALQVENDGGGAAGAGGTILVLANSGGLAGLSTSAAGGNGGVTWPSQAPAAFPGNRHGPGGGGGGGVIFTSSSPAAANVNGGTPGWSTTANDAYGATPGQAGIAVSGLTVTETPGTQSGAYCASADLSITNAGTPNPVQPGNNITYTQVVTNNGPLNAVNASFIEAIPTNTTFVSLTAPGGWTCTTPAVGAAGNINCTNPSVANAAIGTFTLAVKVAAATASGTQILDTASISSGTNDPILTNNSASVLTLVGAANTANIVVTNSAAPNPVQAGQTITYTISVTNHGPAATSSITFSNAIPANTTFLSLAQVGNAWTCTTTGTISCTIATLPAGGTTTFTLVVTVAAATASGTVITDTASTSTSTPDPNPSSNTATSTVLVASAGQFDLAVTSSASPNPVTPGNNITIPLLYSNNGPGSATGVRFRDTVLATVPVTNTFVSISIPAGYICPTLPAVGGTGNIRCCPGTGTTCSAGAFTSGTSALFSLVLQVPLGTAPGTTISNTATITPTTGDVNTANNTSVATTIVASPTQSDVAIVKTAAPEPVDQGTNLTYTLQVTNSGPAVAQGVSVVDVLPSAVTFVSVSSTQGTCSQAGGTVTCSLGSISVGGLVIVTINTTAVTFSSSSLVPNTASVGSTTSDPNMLNNISTAISTIVSPTAVQISSFHAATRSSGGVVLQWRTSQEFRNLGFHVYREDAQGRHQLDPSLIAGGALFFRGGQPQHAAKTYQWIDPQGGPGSSYLLEDVDINGVRNTHGPVSPDSTIQDAAPATQPVLFNQLSKSMQAAASSASSWGPHRPIVNPTASAEVSSAFLDALPAAKISVESEGWYIITRAQLISAGFDPGNDGRMLQLFAEGTEQPMKILSSQSNLSAGQLAGIAFYGTGIDTPFSDTRVYWLINGSQPGKRIPETPSKGSNVQESPSFASTVTLEQRTTYFAALLNGPDADNFFGAPVSTEPVDQVLTVNHYDPTSTIPATLDVTLQGVTTGQAHSVSVTLNGSSLGVLNFNDEDSSTSTFPVEQGMIQNGANTVTLTALDGDNDSSLVQSIILNFPHTYTADSNWLRATAPAGARLKIGGFSNSQIQAYDITDPTNIVQLAGDISLDSSGSSVSVTLPRLPTGSATHTFIAFSADQIASPSAIGFHPSSTLEQQKQGSDIVIITHPDFVSTVAPLVGLRKSQQHTVTVVTVDQLFDAYNFGERSPFALRNYLQFAATNWNQKPQSLLLLGDASLDPRNYLGFGDFDFVPTRIIETAAFKTASDDWLTDFQDSGFATIPTGRIPARTAADATLVISKIVNYESGSSQGAWTQQALVIADQNTGDNFTNEANTAAALLPPSLVTTTILADGQPTDVVSQQIQTALNAGALLVNYTGHGAEQQWSFTDILDDTSAAALTNGGRLPVFLLMDCLNGFFHDVFATSLSTSLLLAPNGGAVAVWASSGFTTAPPQAQMDQSLLRTLAANPSQSLGAAILAAKSKITDPDVRRTWILFGDPAMRIAFPAATAASPMPVRVVPHPTSVTKPIK
jgi:uncharacterized repeat protein (TIGR01451 family)